MRYIVESDYSMQIKPEIIRLLGNIRDHSLTVDSYDWYNSSNVIRAEHTAIAQIRNRIGKRYNCDVLFGTAGAPLVGDHFNRDQWIVTIVIDITLYHLYSQTGMKDIPQHRQDRYSDAIDWLRDVGNGTTQADLLPVTDTEGTEYSEVKIWSRPPENHKW
jgi:hypothetical protein